MSGFLDQAAQKFTTVAPCDHATAADNTAVAITLVGQAGYRHYVPMVSGSYDGVPSGGRLTITGLDNDETFDVDIVAAGQFAIPFPPLAGKEGTNLVVTLAAGGAGVIGKLNVFSTPLPKFHDYGGQTLR
jgi:hypothetical protein